MKSNGYRNLSRVSARQNSGREASLPAFRPRPAHRTGDDHPSIDYDDVAMWYRLLAIACALILLPVPAPAEVNEKISALAPSGLVLVLDDKGDELVAQNADRPFVPASVTKIVTAWLAMEVLGGDYRFKTRFYLDDDRVLYVRGGGDPFLISEELALLAPKLVGATGKDALTGVVLDASYYPADIRIPGIEDDDEAYNALNSALAVNFNTIHAVRSGKTVKSAEKQTRSPLWRSPSSRRAAPTAAGASAWPRKIPR